MIGITRGGSGVILHILQSQQAQIETLLSHLDTSKMMLSGVRKMFTDSQYVKWVDGPPKITRSDGTCRPSHQSHLRLTCLPGSGGNAVALTGVNVGVQHMDHVKNICLTYGGFTICEWDEFQLKLIQDRFFKKQGSSLAWFDPFLTLSKVSSVSPEFPLHVTIDNLGLSVELHGADDGGDSDGTHEKFACETRTQDVDMSENQKLTERQFSVLSKFKQKNLLCPTRGFVVLCKHALDEIRSAHYGAFDMKKMKEDAVFYFSRESITVDGTEWHIYVVPTPIIKEGEAVTFCDPSVPATHDQLFDAFRNEIDYVFKYSNDQGNQQLPNKDIKITPLESWNVIVSINGKSILKFLT